MDTHIHHQGGIKADRLRSVYDLPTRLRVENSDLEQNALGIRLPILDEAASVLEYAMERAVAAEFKLNKIQAIVVDALANADDSEVGWDAEISASALHEILEDS